MKHDEESETRQNAALVALASAIQGVAAASGTHTGDLVALVNGILFPTPEAADPVPSAEDAKPEGA